MDFKVHLKSITIQGLFLALVMINVGVQAQTNIVKAEYFINEDPGFGLGIPIDIGTGTTPTFDVNFDAETDTLSPGYHFIYVRSQDELGVWSYLEGRSFYVIEPTTIVNPVTPKIVGVEYFINNDPGQGLATFIDVPDDFTVDIPSLVAQTDTLSAGYHIIGTRAKTEYGNWGWYERRSFYVTTTGSVIVTPVQKIIDIEYYFDDDPGQGQATSLGPYSPNLTFDLNELIPTSLSAGYHTFNVRSKDEQGHWGFVEQRPIYVITAGSTTSITDINKIEYFFDGVDPGVGQATNMPITSGQIIDLNTVDIPTSPALIDGEHTITFRARNGNGWGLAEVDTFDVLDDCTQPIADFTPQLACAGEPVQFIDISTDLQLDAQYKWYFDGDNIADDFTSGNTSFTFINPGFYDIGLAISQGTICYDSVGYQIFIKPKPVALFTPQGLVEGLPTNFDVVTSNVDPGATWEWDFENDLIVDDNTVGNTSFTYPSAAVYTASLTITDNLGCGTRYTTSFTIQPEGGGGGSPSSDFVASSECEGTATVFTDLSENIPVGAIYSWDFDDDGIEDDNSTGSTLFTYAAPGDYVAQLSIDLGGGNILTTQQPVSVTKVPDADFTVTNVCAGETVNFTDQSSNLEAGAIFSWDFENDGTVDDNTAGSNTNTYANPGTYLATLSIDNGSGCIIQTTRQVEIDPVPVAQFTYSGSCTGSGVIFSSTSLNLVPGSTIEWDFESDGTIDESGTSNPVFQFANPGDYNVSLTISQPNGCGDIFVETLTIAEIPIPGFSYNSNCVSDDWIFTDESEMVDGTSVYSWDFDGDGVEDSNVAGDATFNYGSAGTYVARLNVDNGSGCIVSFEEIVEVTADPVPDFQIVGGCVGEEIFILDKSTSVGSNAVYSWDFDGDGIEDSQSSGDVSFVFDNPGDYTFNLSIDNGNGCQVTKTQDIILHGVPSADFEVLSDCFGLPSRFVDLSSEVSSEAIYYWDFDGDGISDDNTIGDTEFIFTEFKPYIATLTIDNGLGCTNVAEVIVDFRDAAAPDFLVGPSCINVETVFTDQSSELETAATYSWDFNGDGLEDSNVPGSTFYTYTQPGVYEASLTIFNAELCSATRTIQVEVTPPPAIDLGDDVELCTEGTVTIDAGTGYTSYFWNDGSTDQTLTVDGFGEYWVSITDVKGCRNIDTVEVKLKDLPSAQFEYTVTYSPIDGIIVDFENSSTDADLWAWDFGDGQTSDEQSPSNTYVDFSFFEDTPYTVCLTATDRCDQVSQYCEDLLLSPLLIGDINDNQINVFPNPGTGDFILDLNDMDPEELIVVDQKGMIVKRQNISMGTSRIQVDLNEHRSGIYLFIISTSEKQFFRKVILDKK